MSKVAVAGLAGQVLVDIHWLVKHQNDDGLVIVDARSYEEYKKGHIKGAVNIPVGDTFNPVSNTDRVGNLRHISALFSNAGIRNDHKIVIYDGNTYIDAGRVFWVLEVYGHKNVMLLDGGITGWSVYSGQSLSQVIVKPEKTVYIPAVEPERLVTKLSMHLALSDKRKVIIDARTKEEFTGIESIALRSGHIPNAVSIPWTENFIEIDGIKMLKPIEELQFIYNDIAQDKQVLLYCNKGKQSSLSYTILRQLGHDAAHYDGSWYEWGNDESLPIENIK
ncbi:MAG: sulfurtransferase [endosymbiont of Galathealinum brachiosum]|uniref:Sulfurtransferase n=1 Tax=endosymbiont of Galathealinum brachiosum TaxID=2200906 RepID=A0A370DAI8_9GAMM|nr:MAG: sulfurtransferase [endosymbiont of Galathealinum brachiosum]